jgi:small subunit ribosomal protein S3
MGQKTNPIGARLGIIRGWESNWYGSKKDYASKLIEDNKIRTYLNARINKGGIAKIVIERTLNKLIVTIHTSKPGIIIGKGGGEVDRIKEELKKLTGKDDVQINILEIRRPELDANIVGDTIARQIENRINYKRAIKMAIASALRMGAEGIKIKVSGRLGGAEIARTEEIKQGRTPLHTLRMDIDYANVFALTVYGKIGIKVWICKGEVLTKRDLNPNFVGGKSDVSDRRDRRDGDHGHHRDHRDHRDDRRGGGDRGGDRGRSGSGGGERRSGGGSTDRRPGGGDRRPGGAGGDRRPGGVGGGRR